MHGKHKRKCKHEGQHPLPWPKFHFVRISFRPVSVRRKDKKCIIFHFHYSEKSGKMAREKADL